MNASTAELIRVAIVEDQAMVLGALAALLERAEGIQVVAQVRSGREALEAVAAHKPDVLIADIEMPEMSGLELADRLKGHAGVRVIVLTTFARPGYLRRAVEAGAFGYLLKDSPARELADAVRKVYRGERVINSELAAEALGEPEAPLTERERQVLRLAGEGVSGEQIATRLKLSQGTVRNYLSEAISKLGAANRVDAARIARAKGWL
jgi:two-component system, NarL family, response regulator DesR